QHRGVAVRFDAEDAAVTVLADRETPVRIERQSVRARLMEATDVDARVAALGPKQSHCAVWSPAVDRVRVGRAEQKRSLLRPDRALGELEAAGNLLEP